MLDIAKAANFYWYYNGCLPVKRNWPRHLSSSQAATWRTGQTRLLCFFYQNLFREVSNSPSIVHLQQVMVYMEDLDHHALTNAYACILLQMQMTTFCWWISTPHVRSNSATWYGRIAENK